MMRIKDITKGWHYDKRIPKTDNAEVFNKHLLEAKDRLMRTIEEEGLREEDIVAFRVSRRGVITAAVLDENGEVRHITSLGTSDKHVDNPK